MKIRSGFVSNSSSSCFLLLANEDKEKVLTFCKTQLEKSIEKRIEKIKQYKDKCCSNWEKVIEYYEDDLKNLDNLVKVDNIKDFEDWELSEYFDMEKIDLNGLVLYDTDDNILNQITDAILHKYKVQDYIEHT